VKILGIIGIKLHFPNYTNTLCKRKKGLFCFRSFSI